VSAFAGDDVILGVESRDELGEDTPVIMRLSVDTMVTVQCLHQRKTKYMNIGVFLYNYAGNGAVQVFSIHH
jgi:hypothetical protein